MRPNLATLPCAVVLLLAATGCNGGDRSTRVFKEGPADTSTLTLVTSWKPGRGGMMYTEGAVQRFRLTDAAGLQIEPDPVAVGTGPLFSGLTHGTYTLNAGQRPCDGNCDNLDGLTDTCMEQLTVDADLTVHVAFTVGSPCRITVR
jgi:hypothetical protein